MCVLLSPAGRIHWHGGIERYKLIDIGFANLSPLYSCVLRYVTVDCQLPIKDLIDLGDHSIPQPRGLCDNQATGLPPELPYSCSPHAFISEVRRVRFYGGIVTADTWTRTRGFLGSPGEKRS